MSEKWTTRAYSDNSTPVELTEELLNEKVVLLLQGQNSFGDNIYSYLQLTIRNLENMKKFLVSGEKFMPADFGTVLAAGRGDPPLELRSEMAVRYKLVDRPVRTSAPKPDKPKLGSFAPKPSGA